MKSIVEKIFESSPFLRFIFLRIRNQLKVDGNPCIAENIHFSGNKVFISGKSNALLCAKSSFLRQCVVRIEGSGNSTAIKDNSTIYGENHQTVFIAGNENCIIVGKNCTLRKVSFFIRGNRNKIIIEDNCSLYAAQFHIEQDENEIHIGSGTTFHGREEHSIQVAVDEGSRVQVGKDCMLSHGVQIRSTDSHSIVDETGVRLNPASDVEIGNHCWLGLQSILLKGTVVGAHCVIGAGAVCSKKYVKPNCVIAGNPASIVKEKIDWGRKLI